MVIWKPRVSSAFPAWHLEDPVGELPEQTPPAAAGRATTRASQQPAPLRKLLPTPARSSILSLRALLRPVQVTHCVGRNQGLRPQNRQPQRRLASGLFLKSFFFFPQAEKLIRRFLEISMEITSYGKSSMHQTPSGLEERVLPQQKALSLLTQMAAFRASCVTKQEIG